MRQCTNDYADKTGKSDDLGAYETSQGNEELSMREEEKLLEEFQPPSGKTAGRNQTSSMPVSMNVKSKSREKPGTEKKKQFTVPISPTRFQSGPSNPTG